MKRYRNNDRIEPYFHLSFVYRFLETRLAREHHLDSLSNFTHRLFLSFFSLSFSSLDGETSFSIFAKDESTKVYRGEELGIAT